MLTDRLEVRLPIESDRDRFVALFCDPDFMVFSAGVHDAESAHARFEQMLLTANQLPFAKQPIVELGTKTIVGYAGAAWLEFEGARRLEFGYRLVPEARRKGYATEAGRALLTVAGETFRGELMAIIDPRNRSSMRVIIKLGFTFWKEASVEGYRDNLYRRIFG
jgi:RimJ/RimL family protein N-acetyltransferase